METIKEAISNGYLDNQILNAIKWIRDIKKLPDCSSICDNINELLSNSAENVTEKDIVDRLHYLILNNKLKNKRNNGKDSYFIINETPLNHKKETLIPPPANCETPTVKDKLLTETKLPNGNDSNILKEHLIDSYKDIPGETEDCILTEPKNATATNKY